MGILTKSQILPVPGVSGGDQTDCNQLSISGDTMKESTFCLVITVCLFAISLFDGDPIRSIIALVLGSGFMFTGTVCRAVERNGKER